MSKLTQRIQDRRLAGRRAESKSAGFAAKGYATGIFAGIAIWFIVMSVKSEDGVLNLIVSMILGLLFLSVAVLIVLEKEVATKLGILSVGLLCLLLLYNVIVSGSLRVGFIWLIALFLATKKLMDYDNYASSKTRGLD